MVKSAPRQNKYFFRHEFDFSKNPRKYYKIMKNMHENDSNFEIVDAKTRISADQRPLTLTSIMMKELNHKLKSWNVPTIH